MKRSLAALLILLPLASCGAGGAKDGSAAAAGSAPQAEKVQATEAAAPASAASPSSPLAALGLSVFPQPQPLPDFSVEKPDGGTVSMSSFKGKYVLLNFWATWCPPCREEMPSMQTLFEKFGKDSFAILAVSVREDKNTVRSFLKDHPYTFPIGMDPDGKVSSMFVGRGIPTTYVVDPEGRAIAGMIGGRKWDSPEAFAAFGELIGK